VVLVVLGIILAESDIERIYLMPSTRWTILLVFCLTLAVFSGGIRGEFVEWDDDINIYENVHLESLSSQNVMWMLTDSTYVRRYMPLGWFGWGIERAIFGLNPVSYHLGNVLLHGLNAILVFLLIRGLFACSSPEGNVRAPLGTWFAGAGALFWALHPLRVEVVAWASGRLYDQATFFLLLSLLAYLRYCTKSDHKHLYFGLCAACFAASLLTYPIALFAVFLFPIIDLYPLKRVRLELNGFSQPAWRSVWIEKLPLFLITALLFGLTVWARTYSSGPWKPPKTMEQFGLLERAAQAFYVWACYLWKTAIPVNLSPLYTNLRSFDPLAPVFLFSFGLVLSLSAVILWRRRRWPLLAVLWGTYLLLMVPMLGLTEHPHYANDRYNHITGILFAILVTGVLNYIYERRAGWTLPALSSAMSAVLVLAALSYYQTGVWKNSVVLYEYMISNLGQDSYRGHIHNRLATFQLAHGNTSGAIENYKASLAIKSNQIVVLQTLSLVLTTAQEENLRSGPEAVQFAERACAIEQNANPRSLKLLAGAYSESGRYEEAISTLQKAQALDLSTGNTDELKADAKLLEFFKAGKGVRAYLAAIK
jgi:tetratricopeptide (TPR) repeat protein